MKNQNNNLPHLENLEDVDFTKYNPLIGPSIMCADPWDVKTYLEEFEKCQIDLIHYDVMDGQFVPNIMLGTEMYSAIHKVSSIPMDLHLMTLKPENVVDYFDVRKGDWVSFHPETCNGPYKLLCKIKDKGARAGVALSPATPIDIVLEVSEVVDFVLLMAIEPGFSGLKMLPNHLDKVARLAKLREEHNLNFTIMVDGNVNVETLKQNLVAGAQGFGIGSSLLWGDMKAEDFCKTYAKFRADIGLLPV